MKALERYLLNTLNSIDTQSRWHITKHTLYPYITNDKVYVKIQAFADSMVLLIFHRAKRQGDDDVYSHDHVHDIPIGNHEKVVEVLKERVLTKKRRKDKLPVWWNNDLIER